MLKNVDLEPMYQSCQSAKAANTHLSGFNDELDEELIRMQYHSHIQSRSRHKRTNTDTGIMEKKEYGY